MIGQNNNIQQIFTNLSSSPKGLTSDEVHAAYEQFGPNAIEETKENIVFKILKYFWGPIPWMIEAAAILSFLIQHYLDFAFISTLLVFNASIAFWQEFQAGNALAALKRKMAITSRVLRDNTWKQVPAEELVPGDVIRIRPGDIIPADALLFEGDYLSTDQSTLTGESLPVNKNKGDSVYSGSVAQKGEMSALVTSTGKNTFFGKTAELVSTSKSISHFQKAVIRIGNFLICFCLVLVGLIISAQILRGGSLAELLKFCLILIVASIPVAMPAVLSVTMAIGALALSKMKSIVTRLESIEEMAGVDTLCCDKTGTLTYNKLIMGSPQVFSQSTQDDIILYASLASRIENLDAIDQAIFSELHDKTELEKYQQTQFIPFDPVRKRTEATIQRGENTTFQVAKGAPQVILALCNPPQEIIDRVKESVSILANKGDRALGVAKTDKNGNWEFEGIIPFFDQVRDDSAAVVQQANEHGINVKMLTGDHLAIAKEIALQVGIGDKMYEAQELLDKKEAKKLYEFASFVEEADGFSQVFPESKHLVIKALQSKDHIVGMTGDGVNDAPALKQADLGIAVSGAVDAARAAASLILTAPGLAVIIKSIEEARRIFERMNTYSIYRIAETIRVMLFMTMSMILYDFYPITALMLILLALLNDIPIMTIAYDRATLPQKPAKWEMQKILTISTLLGVIGVISSFTLLFLADSFLHLHFAEIQSILFLKLSLAGHQTLFVARSRRAFWTKPYPAPILITAIIGTQFLATLLVGFGIFLPQLSWIYIGWIWIYAWTWMLIADRIKVLVYKHFIPNHIYAD